jgi:hypothetical protein
MVSDDARCKLCDAVLSAPILDLGALPICNRFSLAPAALDRYPLAMTACPRCGLVQLSAFPSIGDVVPRVPWIRYTEPDAHLDAVVDCLDPSIATVFGLGPFDGPLLTRLGARRKQTCALDLGATQGENGVYPYLETLQDALRPDRLAAVAARHGGADLVVLRYLLEHSHDPIATLEGLKPLVAPRGALCIEVPDSSKFLTRHDYSFIWEEHICYFTVTTLGLLAARAGYAVDYVSRYEGPLEDALVAILRPAEKATSMIGAGEATTAFRGYRDSFVPTGDAYRKRLAEALASGSRVAICGIGHQAIMFLNALGLQSFIAMMVDDDPNKAGQFAPGATSAIASSAAMMADRTIDVCLLAVNPRSEAKIKEKLRPFAERGGRFYSIFPGAGTPTLVDAA